MHQKFDPAFFPEEVLPTVYLKNLLPAHFTRERDISPWGLLMDAVVLQAAEDYREACSILRADAQNEEAADRKKEVEEFFLSEFCLRYTALPGRMILEKLEEEQEEIWTDRNCRNCGKRKQHKAR